MSSVVTTSDSPTFRKNMSVDNDDIKEELNYLTKEVDALNTILVQKDKEIDHWRSKVQDESELKDIVSDLQAKLQQALGETKELKEAQAAKQNQLQSKYIEKTQHNKEIVELKAKINYLTSENERLNKIISSKFDSWQSQGDNGAGSRLGEEEKSELVGKLESYSKENERLEKLVQENAIEILEWKTKSAELEAENHKLKAEVKEQEEEVEILKKANEEKDKQIVEFKTKKDRLTQSQEENEKLVKSLEAKKKEIEEIKAKYAGVEKKEAELALLKERYQMTVKENENLHVVIVGKDMEIEELKLRCEEFDRNVELIKEQESMINKLTIEKDELMIRYNGRNEALKKEKEINQNLTTECNELQANLRFVEQQNMELMQVTEGYEKMIEDLKNTVVKGEKGTYRMLNFDPDSLA